MALCSVDISTGWLLDPLSSRNFWHANARMLSILVVLRRLTVPASMSDHPTL